MSSLACDISSVLSLVCKAQSPLCCFPHFFSRFVLWSDAGFFPQHSLGALLGSTFFLKTNESAMLFLCAFFQDSFSAFCFVGLAYIFKFERQTCTKSQYGILMRPKSYSYSCIYIKRCGVCVCVCLLRTHLHIHIRDHQSHTHTTHTHTHTHAHARTHTHTHTCLSFLRTKESGTHVSALVYLLSKTHNMKCC